MGCRADLWLLCVGMWMVKCFMLPFIFFKNIRRSKRLPPPRSKLLYYSATQLADMIRTGQVKSEDVVQAYIDRINEVNPLLNCVMDNRFEAAILDARFVDRVVQSGSRTVQQMATETPFLGVPMSVKESIAVKGMKNSSGQQRLDGKRAQEDAETVRLMRAAGAIPLVVTSTPELCMMIETYNKIIGTSNNPHDLRRTPGGSSGGEASLLSSAGSVIGLGSDIGGSLRIPAAFTGIFAHKPTPGAVPHTGHNPNCGDENWSRFFTIGPMMRYAEDLKPMLKVLANKNADKLLLDERVNIKNIKFYYMEDDGGSPITSAVARDVKAAMQRTVHYLQSVHGATVKKVDIKEMKYANDISGPLILQLNGLSSSQRSVDPESWKAIFRDILKFYTCMSDTTFPPICYSVVKKLSCGMSKSKLKVLKERNSALKKEFYAMLGNDGVFLYPTFIDGAHYHLESYYKILNISYTLIMNALEVPATNCPVGKNKHGMPIGIQIVTAPWQDRLSIAVAIALEAAFGGWIEPPTSDKVV
ncbi:fatty-acid amide hydrolase 2-B [Periplaneta americana]|uniref:fatty-acid amide hydrolase 2-B n=1 Tax=Periplaneta americana TaxID=6978 RepID=UPI0037E71619